MRPEYFFGLVILAVLALTGCGAAPTESDAPEPETQPAVTQPPHEPAAASPTSEKPSTAGGEPSAVSQAFTLTSSAFEADGDIPVRYTCDGEDISPPLAWRGAPERTQSFALIMDDPDAPVGTFTHWVVFDLPADVAELAEDVSSGEALRAHQGMTSFRKAAYGGPCPPSGVHHYIFTLYAVDTLLDLPAGASKKELLAALEGRILGQTELVGLYSRQ